LSDGLSVYSRKPLAKDEPNRYEHPEFDWIISKILDFRGRGMTGESIAYSFLRRGIQLLQKRQNPGFKYEGLNDPSRVLRFDIPHPEVMKRMKKFLNPTMEQPALFEEFSAENPPRRVSKPSILSRRDALSE
jgi:hypothetical protein